MSINSVSTSLTNREIERISSLDKELVRIMEGFLILGPLSWPKEAMDHFLEGVNNNQFKMPKITYPKANYKDKIKHLSSYIAKIGKEEHPAMRFLSETAESYLDAYMILQGTGTKDVNKYSRKLYGGPKDLMPGYKKKNVDIARYFLRVVEDYKFNMAE